MCCFPDIGELVNLFLPTSLVDIRELTFLGCYRLRTEIVPKKVTAIIEITNCMYEHPELGRTYE